MNTCNGRQYQQWRIVFRHEYVSLIWLREQNPLSIAYKGNKKKPSHSYVPVGVSRNDPGFCYCGISKVKEKDACDICESKVMHLVKQSVADGNIHWDLQAYFES